jgi:diaminopropionate ammonia-lyase
MDGTQGPRAKIVRKFVERLSPRLSPQRVVHFHDERLSTAQADAKMARTGLTHKQKKERRDAIAAYGAEVRQVAGNYDDSVRAASAAAESNGWHVISDTSWPGYTEPPRDVMQGYRLMAEEALAAMPEPPTHVFVQGGVGGVAAAVSVQLRARRIPAKLIVVEPDEAACLLLSAEAGEIRVVEGDLPTLMAGLACGEPSLLAWQELERAAHGFMAVPDAAAVEAMRALAPLGIVAGESAVAGLVGAILAGRDGALGLGPDSRVLVFGTEGATDPELYARLVATS